MKASRNLGAAFLLALLVIYTLVIMLSTGHPAVSAFLDALMNVVPLAVIAVGALALNRRILFRWRPVLQLPMQVMTALLFAALWYFSVTVLLAWKAGDFNAAFSVRPFPSPAFAWQMFQGVTLYALVVSLAIIEQLQQRLAASAADRCESTKMEQDLDRSGPERLLVRTDDEWTTIGLKDIISASRAGDYVQIVTVDQRHLVRRSLAELLKQLPADRFMQIHRSHLINLDALESAESIGGGRLRVRLQGGLQIETSRNGAQRLRRHAR